MSSVLGWSPQLFPSVRCILRGYFVQDGRRRVACTVGLPVFVPNMWAMHLPRARINAPHGHHGSRARVSWFWFLAGRGRLFHRRRAEGSTMQLQPNRGNLYDDAFNHSIKTESSNAPDETKMKGSFARMRLRSPIVTYTIISANTPSYKSITKVLPGR